MKTLNKIFIKYHRFFHSYGLIIGIYSLLGLMGIFNHSMWRDEMNTWLIIRDSKSLIEVINNIHYQGHPLLWGMSILTLRNIFKFFFDYPLLMQLFHICLTITSIALFLFYSPFTYKQKLLFTFGYFPLYEYYIIARPYGLGMLFLFLFCTIFEKRKKSYLLLALLLGLMANSNAYTLFISFSLLLMLIAELCFNKQQKLAYFKNSKKYDIYLSIFILILLYFISIVILIPPGDSINHGGLTDNWRLTIDFKHLLITIGNLFGSYIMIIPSQKRWLDLIFCGVIAMGILFLTVFKVIKKPYVLLFFLSGNITILLFTYLKLIGGYRHFGHLYLVLIATLWLTKYYENQDILVNKFLLKDKLLNILSKWHYYIFMLILYCHLLAGIYGFSRDFFIPYSASKVTANFMIKNQLNHEFIVASGDSQMSALAGYTNTRFYYPELQRIGSFTLFTKERKKVEHTEILQQVNSIFKSKPNLSQILLILNNPLKVSDDNLKITPINQFEKTFMHDEKYYLYFVYPLNN